MSATPIANAYYKGLNDLKVAKLLTDEDGQLATYDALLDCKIVSCEPFNSTYDDAECPHDEVVGDIDSTFKEIDFTMTLATLDLDVLALLDGSTNETSGTGATTVSENILKGTDKPNYFKMELSTLYDKKTSAIKDKHVLLHKCKATIQGGTIQQSAGGYTQFQVKGKAIPLNGDYTSVKGTVVSKPVRSIIHYQAETPIA